MTQAAIKPTPVLDASPKPAARYLSNDEAAAFLHLSPRTLEKQRVIGGGPKFRKFGRRVVYAIDDLEQLGQRAVLRHDLGPELLGRDTLSGR